MMLKGKYDYNKENPVMINEFPFQIELELKHFSGFPECIEWSINRLDSFKYIYDENVEFMLCLFKNEEDVLYFKLRWS